MKKLVLLLLTAVLTVLIFSGCSSKKNNEVSIYMWGGSDSTNQYIDKWVVPKLLKQEGIKLKRVPINSPVDVLNKLATEKQAGKKKGSVDIIWLNGENFKKAKDMKVLGDAFTDKLTNYNKYVDTKSNDVMYDFGEPTEGLEAPWGKVQFVFIYDSAKVKNVPKSYEELKSWIIKNPGKFAYPAPPDFTGSAFIRQGLYELTGGSSQYLDNMNDKEFNIKQNALWKYLNSIKPYLWMKGKTYPESLAKVDQLYSNGEVWMTMGYDEARAVSEINNGHFPKTTKTFIMEKGTLANTHFLTIPMNSPNREGAIKAINFLLSPEAQIAKFNPQNWGDGLAIDYNKLSKNQKKEVDSVDRGASTLNVKLLQTHRLPEIKGKYVDMMVKGWLDNVGKN